MNTTRLDFLFQVDSPWIYIGLGESFRKEWIPSHFYSRSGLSVCVRLLRGHKMRNTKDLMNEFSAALQFFEGFGENWYALEECLCCLDEWLPADAYIIVIERAEELLQEEGSEELATLLKVLNSTGEYWSNPIDDNDRFDRGQIPFHVLMNFSNSSSLAETRITKTACNLGIALRQGQMSVSP